MHKPCLYEKNDHRVVVNDKFIYCCTVYMIWKNGASLVEEKYYSSNKPISLKKKDKKKVMKNYILQTFLDLEFAPENYLINNDYKIVEV